MKLLKRQSGIATNDLGVQKVNGLMGWIFGLLQNWQSGCELKPRRMRLVETLVLDGKRRLILVSCDGEQFLVGGGVESVNTIVRIKAEEESRRITGTMDSICQ